MHCLFMLGAQAPPLTLLHLPSLPASSSSWYLSTWRLGPHFGASPQLHQVQMFSLFRPWRSRGAEVAFPWLARTRSTAPWGTMEAFQGCGGGRGVLEGLTCHARS